MCSVAGPVGPATWSSSTSGFHRLLARKPVSSETRKRLAQEKLVGAILPGGLLPVNKSTLIHVVGAGGRVLGFVRGNAQGGVL